MTPTPYPIHLPGAPTGQPHNTAVRVNRHEDFEHLPSQPDNVSASARGKRPRSPINPGHRGCNAPQTRDARFRTL
jgi:hypothetical protein